MVVPVLDERSRRRWAAAESLAIGYGGDAVVSSATGLARETIRKGRREIARDEAPTDGIRRPGGGRPRIQQDQPGIQAALEALVDPDRNAQFEHINRTADEHLSIRHWWQQMGCGAYPEATTLFITADAGGSNGYRLHAWKHELQQLADDTGLTIEVSHFPPGTSKWNKIEHRLFCHITANWRGTPLTTYETIVDRIGNVRTATGLRVRAELDAGEYPTGVTVPKEQMDALALVSSARTRRRTRRGTIRGAQRKSEYRIMSTECELDTGRNTISDRPHHDPADRTVAVDP